MTIPEHSAGADALLTAMQQAPWEQAAHRQNMATVLKARARYLASDLPGQPVETVSEMIQYGFALGYVLPNNEAQALHHYKPNLPKTLQTIDHNLPVVLAALTDPAHILIETAADYAAGEIGTESVETVILAIVFGAAAGYVAKGKPPRGTANPNGEAGSTNALLQAASDGDLTALEAALAAGADANSHDKSIGPLRMAAQYGHADCVRALIEAGADVDAESSDGFTPLAWAASQGYSDCVSALVEAGADVNATVEGAETPLMWAANAGDADRVELLIAAGARIDALDCEGTTALAWAAESGCTDCVKALINAGADVNMADHGYTPLMLAAFYDHADCIAPLLAAGADINAKKCDDGYTALMYAAESNSPACVQALLAAGADVNVKGNACETALWLAEAPKVIAALRNAGAVG